VLNRWGIKPHTHAALFHSWFNDVLLIPSALPPLLWLHRRLGWRAHDDPPTGCEILGHLIVWSLLFELFGPHWVARATGDWRDVIAYALGGALAWAWWHRGKRVHDERAMA
jgi:hypothetical protein